MTHFNLYSNQTASEIMSIIKISNCSKPQTGAEEVYLSAESTQ